MCLPSGLVSATMRSTHRSLVWTQCDPQITMYNSWFTTRSAGYIIYLQFDFLGAKRIEVGKQLTM